MFCEGKPLSLTESTWRDGGGGHRAGLLGRRSSKDLSVQVTFKPRAAKGEKPNASGCQRQGMLGKNFPG